MKDYLSSPAAPSSPFDEDKGRPDSRWANIKATVAAIKAAEGRAGFAQRAAILERNFLNFFGFIGFALFNQWALSSVGWGFAGAVMLMLVAAMALVAAIGTLLYPQARWEIPKEFKSAVWAKMVLPVSAISLLNKFIHMVAPAESEQAGPMRQVVAVSLPIIFLVTCVSVAGIFVQWTFTNHGMTRNKLSSREMGQIITRQDGLQH